MISTLKYISILLTVVFFFCSCDDNPKPDACAGKQAITANFTIHEDPSFFDKYKTLWEDYPTDTLLCCRTSSPRFRADLDSTAGTNYKWEIGKSVYNTRWFYLDFGYELVKKNNLVVPIKLTVSRPKDPCHPDLDTVITFSKNIVWVPQEKTLLVGRYAGEWSGSSYNFLDTVSISNTYFEKNFSDNKIWWTSHKLRNFSKSIWWFLQDSNGATAYKQIVDEYGNEQFFLTPNDNTLRITRIINGNQKNIFIGKRLIY